VRRHAAGLAAAALVALAGGGCESVRSGANAEIPLWARHPSGSMGVAWTRPVTAEPRKAGEEYERGRPEIDAAHRRVFVPSSDHGLYAVRADDGQTIWRFETLGAVQCEPLYDPREDVVYFGSNDGALYKVRAEDGQLLWRFATNSEVARKPVLQHGLVYAVNANDTIVALDQATGKLRWSQHRTPAMGMEIAGYAGPLVTPDRVYVAFSDGHVASYDPKDGSEKWQPVDLSAEAEQGSGDQPRYLDVDTTPIADTNASGRVVYVASFAGGVYALDAETGARIWANDRATGVTDLVLWSQPAHPSRDPALPAEPARKLLLASSGPTGLWALDPNDGREVWRKALPEGGVTAPVPIAGALMVGTSRYGLFLVSPIDGGAIDGIETTGGFAMTPAAHGLRAFAVSNAGRLMALHVQPPLH
jgi:outer membrane protein assembly factor BamB